MRGPGKRAMVVRKADGELVVEEETVKSRSGPARLPSERTHSGMVVHTSPISPVSAVGSKMNSPTDMAMPSTAARVMMMLTHD